VVRGLQAVGMVLQVEPDAVEAHQARELEQRWIAKAHRRDEGRLIIRKFGFDSASQHDGWATFV